MGIRVFQAEGISMGKGSEEVGKDEVRNQGRVRPGLWNPHGRDLGSQSSLGPPRGGEKKRGRAGVPGMGMGLGGAVLQCREERRPPCLHPAPLQGPAVWEVQCVLRKQSDCITGKIKGAKLGLGLGEVCEKGAAKGQLLDDQERLPGARGGGGDPTSGRKPS